MSQYKLENLTSVIDSMNFLKIKPIVTLHRTSHRAEIAASMLAAMGRVR